MNDKLETIFNETLIKNCDKAQTMYNINTERFKNYITSKGGVNVARLLMRKENVSDIFEDLASANHLELSMESLVTDNKFADIFTDDEVNFCFAVLCEKGYFK